MKVNFRKRKFPNYYKTSDNIREKVLIELFQKFADSQGRALSRRPQTAKYSLALRADCAPAGGLEGVKSSLAEDFRSFAFFYREFVCSAGFHR